MKTAQRVQAKYKGLCSYVISRFNPNACLSVYPVISKTLAAFQSSVSN